jgi:hypothetical protein
MGRDLVRRLHFAAKAQGIPMTHYLRRLLDRELPPDSPVTITAPVQEPTS